MTKRTHYDKFIKDIKAGNPRQWYSKLKRITSHDQHISNEINVEEISHLSDQEQADYIADIFASISLEYEKIKNEDIIIPSYDKKSIPQFTPQGVLPYLQNIKINKSNVKGDIPARIIRDIAPYICYPYADLLNSMIIHGKYPTIYKMEIQTPILKVYPPTKTSELRNISGLLNLDKVTEKIIGEMITSDMEKNMDPSQFGNQKSTSIQHYLVKMIHKILTELEGSKFAVVASLIDWKEAFPRQCPKLGVEAFINMGVRPSLIPMLINFFQDRKMQVKWHGKFSEIKELNGSGPQGSTIGLLEYLAQSNNNADIVGQ